MSHRHLFIALFLLSGSALPVAVSAQQPDAKPSENQVQSQSTPAQSQSTPAQSQGTPGQSQTIPVQPERTPQQADQARQQDHRNAEDARINRDWTIRGRGDEHADMDRMRQRHMDSADQDQDGRTVGRNWRRDSDELDRGSRYGAIDRDRDEGRYYEARPRRRVKTCVEYENGDEFCRYRD
jgi:hypothetical protein